MIRHLHIVCLDAPSPPDYGGAIDMYYKIKALAEAGHSIALHYFAYRRQRDAAGLEAYCSEIKHYQRKNFWESSLKQPFIVGSRINSQLIANLNNDNAPVLLEGLHCAGILPFLQKPERVVVRMHNNEAAYYAHLASTEPAFAKRLYLKIESRLLKGFQQLLPKQTKLACLSEHDQRVFEQEYGLCQTAFVPCFVPWQMANGLQGNGDFCLYHGNLLVSENEQAARWLMRNVFATSSHRLVIAGKGASGRLLEEADKMQNVQIINNPTIAEINSLVKSAHVNVLPSLNNTGVKLKLLHALFSGRYCLTNKNGVRGSGIEKGLCVAETAEEWQRTVDDLMHSAFEEKTLLERRDALTAYDNRDNAQKLIALWSHCQ